MGDRSPTAYDEYAGQRLRDARLAAGLSQTELGGRLGVTFQQVQKYERGANRMSVGTVATAAWVFGLSVAYFLPPERDPTPREQIERARDLLDRALEDMGTRR